MHNGTLGARIRSARKRAGLSMEEVGIRVAQAIGRPTPFSFAAVQQWEVGKKVKGKPPMPINPGHDALLAFARLVGLRDTTWLVSGVDVGGTDAPDEAIPTRGRVVPVLTSEQLLEKPLNLQSSNHIHTQADCSEKSFGFAVWDLRNSPEFAMGDRIIIDPEVKPEPGMMVFCVIGGTPVFARYTRPAGKGAKATWVLQSLDRAWGDTDASTKAGDRLIGVMVEHTKIGPRPRYT